MPSLTTATLQLTPNAPLRKRKERKCTNLKIIRLFLYLHPRKRPMPRKRKLLLIPRRKTSEVLVSEKGKMIDS
jgi:hypothetical protein